MTRRRWSSLALVVCLSTACFHQVVSTGRAAGPTVVDKPWVAMWLWGLVAAEPIDVRRECPMGVAIVTTETSFPNGLVGVITFGIFTPQHVTITCASSSASLPAGMREIRIPTGATKEAELAMVRRAIEESADDHVPVAFRF